MRQLATILILIIGSLGLFFTYTKPNYEELSAIKQEIAAYNEALNQADHFKSLKNSLTSKANEFKKEEVDRLTKLLPLNVDNVRLIIEIESIASKHGLSVSGVLFEEESEEENEVVEAPPTALPDGEDIPDQSLAMRPAAQNPYQSVRMTFSVDATYEEFKDFIEDLEDSLRLVDILEISSEVGEEGVNAYTVTFQTYWLGARP